MTRLTDSCHRPISYLRISVTDRCNLRCVYCMPAGGIQLLRMTKCSPMRKLPLLPAWLRNWASLKSGLPAASPWSGLDWQSWLPGWQNKRHRRYCLTTNGILLKDYAEKLSQAGLKRVNISLDTRDQAKFARIARHDKLNEVLQGIEAAKKAGLNPVKINVVAMRVSTTMKSWTSPG